MHDGASTLVYHNIGWEWDPPYLIIDPMSNSNHIGRNISIMASNPKLYEVT